MIEALAEAVGANLRYLRIYTLHTIGNDSEAGSPWRHTSCETSDFHCADL